MMTSSWLAKGWRPCCPSPRRPRAFPSGRRSRRVISGHPATGGIAASLHRHRPRSGWAAGGREFEQQSNRGRCCCASGCRGNACDGHHPPQRLAEIEGAKEPGEKHANQRERADHDAQGNCDRIDDALQQGLHRQKVDALGKGRPRQHDEGQRTFCAMSCGSTPRSRAVSGMSWPRPTAPTGLSSLTRQAVAGAADGAGCTERTIRTHVVTHRVLKRSGHLAHRIGLPKLEAPCWRTMAD